MIFLFMQTSSFNKSFASFNNNDTSINLFITKPIQGYLEQQLKRKNRQYTDLIIQGRTKKLTADIEMTETRKRKRRRRICGICLTCSNCCCLASIIGILLFLIGLGALLLFILTRNHITTTTTTTTSTSKFHMVKMLFIFFSITFQVPLHQQLQQLLAVSFFFLYKSL